MFVVSLILPTRSTLALLLQTDRPNYIALMRTKDVRRCPVRALAESFFVRFVLCNEPFPDPLDKKDWWVPDAMGVLDSLTM